MANATLDQEREALEKIRKIVESLGEESRIGILFGQYSILEAIEEEISDSANEAQDKSDDVWNSWRAERFQPKQDDPGEDDGLSLIDLAWIHEILNARMIDLQTELYETSSRIVELAEMPESDEFKEQVRQNRKYEEWINNLSRIQDKIHKLTQEARKAVEDQI